MKIPDKAAACSLPKVSDMLLATIRAEKEKAQQVQEVRKQMEEMRKQLAAKDNQLSTTANMQEINAAVSRSTRRFQEIVNETMFACPRCKKQYTPDFTGCMAITCPNCKCGFCPLCLKDCGDTRGAHDHFQNQECPWVPNRENFDRAHGNYWPQNDTPTARDMLVNRRVDHLSEFFLGIANPTVRNLTIQECRKDLQLIDVPDNIINWWFLKGEEGNGSEEGSSSDGEESIEVINISDDSDSEKN